MFFVITQEIQKFQQTLVKTISHRGATLWANVKQHFKDKSYNVIFFIAAWMNGRKIFYRVYPIQFFL